MTRALRVQDLNVNKRDPRQSQLFLDLSWFMNNAEARTVKDEWNTLDTQCRTHWREYGYDLQSGCWFCLISLKLRGWDGLAQALNLLMCFWRQSSEICWPPVTEPDQRRYLLEWFNTNVVTCIYTLNYSAEFLMVAGKIIENIALLHDEAVKANARCKNSLKNLHYFLQVRNRASASLILNAMPAETGETSQPASSLTRNNARLSVNGDRIKRKHLFGAGGAGLLGGMVTAILLMSGIKYTEKPALTESLIGVLRAFPEDEALTATAWQRMNKEDLEGHRDEILRQASPLLHWVADQPGDELRRKGALLAERLEKTWPGNPVSQKWNRELLAKANSLPTTQSYKEITADLDTFDAKLTSTEQKKGGYLTISELKSFSWKIRRELERGGIPPAEFIRSSANKEESLRKTDLKSAADNLSALSALYFLSVKQNDDI